MKYTQDEINKIIMSKKIDEFYVAMLQDKPRVLQDDEYEKIKNGDIGFADDQIGFNFLAASMMNSENEMTQSILQALIGISGIRASALLTMIGDDIYNVATLDDKFVDTDKTMIVSYENLSKFCNSQNASFRVVSPNELPDLEEDTVLFDPGPAIEAKIQRRYDELARSNDSKDLTEEFIAEATAQRGKI